MRSVQHIINVSNRLPVTVGSEITKSSGGLVAALEGIDKSAYDLHWLGWPGANVPEADRESTTRTLENDFGCTPIYLSDEEIEGHYDGFSNSSLWSLLHYMPSRFRYQAEWWDAYRSVNARFAEAVIDHAPEGALVWVHDYHLLLLPSLLKARRSDLRVGFFLHTPFPSYEVFRCHPNREDLLRGMLGADLIGFHTFGYLRHFRSAVMRLLGVDGDVSEIRHPPGSTRLGVFPIGINAGAFRSALETEEFAEHLSRFRETFHGKRIVLSVERLDYSKGLPQRLEAIERYLSRTDEATRNGIKFIFVSIPSRENVEEYRLLREDIESRIGRLNGKYTTLVNSPIHFIHGSVKFAELCALYAMAEVALVTPLVDGMNLVAKEYVACQKKDAGVLVLSEFAGAAQELFNALIVNPYDIEQLAQTLAQALAMPKAERMERMHAMLDRVLTLDAGVWAREFIQALAKTPAANVLPGDSEEPLKLLTEAARAGRKISLFLDYDGSLREIETAPEAAKPSAPLLQLLTALDKRPDIRTTIISGRTPADLEAFVGQFRSFGLVAEHGARLRRPGAAEWEDRAAQLNLSWKAEVLKILKMHAAFTPGSWVEEKRTSLVWHYRLADPEFGEWKSRQLLSDLSNALANAPVRVRQGKKIVEVTPLQIDKGEAVAQLWTEQPADVVLAVGDDTTDEHMFTLDRPGLISIKIGAGDTRANYRLRTPARLRELLSTFLEQTA